MFEYYKGYEIDGSDTSYSLLTPNFEKLKEMLKFFFSLKVIDKNKMIRLKNAKRKDEKYAVNNIRYKIDELEGKKYSRENIDELFDDLIKYDVDYVTIIYHYVKIESLFPEVKRELIDYIIAANKDLNLEYHNPVLFGSLSDSTEEELYINFKPNIDRYGNDLTPDSLTQLFIKDEYYSLDFALSVVTGGIPSILPYYIMEKFSERFPEYGLNAFEDYNDINCCGKVYVDSAIYECFEILPEDFNKIFSNEKFRFIEWEGYRDYKYIENDKIYANEVLRLQKYYYSVLHKEYKEEDGVFLDSYGLGKSVYSKQFTIYSLLKRYIKDDTNYVSYDDYVNFCKDLSEKMKLKVVEIKAYTNITLHISKNDGSEKYHVCNIRFNKEKGRGVFELIVPRTGRELVESLLKN